MAIIDKPTDYFNSVLWTGNGSARSITGVGFAPDLVWSKGRQATSRGLFHDTIRGATKYIDSTRNIAETTNAQGLTAFGSDGFSLGTTGEVNYNGDTFVAWNWKAGGTASSNTDGSITSNVSANTTSGFSIGTYTGNGTAGATIGHGLASDKVTIIVKRTDTTSNWGVKHYKIPATQWLQLDQTDGANTSSIVWNNTEPTSSVFSVGSYIGTNASGGTYVFYAFAEKQGFSKFGKYTSINSHDSTFVYLGFKPSMIIFKNTSYSSDWHILDRTRYTFNGSSEAVLEPNTSDGENYSAFGEVDFLSNGFKIRNNNGVSSGGYDHIYMAFAEQPLVTSTGVPATAR